jgi:hypothetical protein
MTEAWDPVSATFNVFWKLGIAIMAVMSEPS